MKNGLKVISATLYLLIMSPVINLQAADLTVKGQVQRDTLKTAAMNELQKYPAFYKKHTDADGILIMGSANVSDTALFIAKSIVIKMLAKIPAIKRAIINNNVQIILVAHNEEMSDVPEYKGFDTLRDQEGTILNARLRGLGPTAQKPYLGSGEENLICSASDTHKGENILVHEFAHAISILGISSVDTSFQTTLQRVYQEAKNKGLWKNTYAMANYQEYFAEGVQCWFNVCRRSVPGDGVANEISRRSELRYYDPTLYNLLSKYFFADDSIKACR
jgi:hypothetical protein